MMNSSNFTGMLWHANEMTGDWFGTVLVLVMYGVFFISFMDRRPVDESFLAANFLTLILTMLLRVIGVVHDREVVILIVLTLMSAIIMFRKHSAGEG